MDATDFLFTKLPSMAARRHRYMSAQKAHATVYDFVRIRKGSPSGQMWHMVWQVETVLGVSLTGPGVLEKARPAQLHALT